MIREYKRNLSLKPEVPIKPNLEENYPSKFYFAWHQKTKQLYTKKKPTYHLHLRRFSKDIFYVQGYYFFHINLPAYSPFQCSAVAIETILHDHTVSGDLTFNKSLKAQSLKNISRFVQKFCHEFSLEDWQVPRHIQTNVSF